MTPSTPKVSVRMRRNAPLLYALANVSDKVRARAMRAPAKDFVLALVEIAKNIIIGNVRMSQAQLDSLSRYREDIRKLVKKKTSLSEKVAIVQTGGFIGLLLKPLLGVLGGILGAGGRR